MAGLKNLFSRFCVLLSLLLWKIFQTSFFSYIFSHLKCRHRKREKWEISCQMYFFFNSKKKFIIKTIHETLHSIAKFSTKKKLPLTHIYIFAFVCMPIVFLSHLSYVNFNFQVQYWNFLLHSEYNEIRAFLIKLTQRKKRKQRKS